MGTRCTVLAALSFGVTVGCAVARSALCWRVTTEAVGPAARGIYTFTPNVEVSIATIQRRDVGGGRRLVGEDLQGVLALHVPVGRPRFWRA